MENNRCCYVGTVAEFQNLNADDWKDYMIHRFHQVYPDFPLEENENRGQIKAWKNCFKVMQSALANAKNTDTNYIVFEYKLPYEGGRRPDVLLISASSVVVLEFKDWDSYHVSQADQLIGYKRDLEEYHFATRGKKVHPILVLTLTQGLCGQRKGVYVRSPDTLTLECLSSKAFDVNEWLNSRYEPLPSILQAARLYAENEPLPEIRQAHSAGIPEAMDFLHKMVQYAFNNKKHLLAFVTGVPGAGKTLLGLQLVYKETEHSTWFLSGNDPLVEVLRYTLKSKSLVNRIYNIKNEKSINRNIIVFDEGQRAWPEEPQLLINLMTQCLEWGVLLILVGEGQDIHRKEQESLQPWVDVLTPDWDVACPSKLAPLFKTAKFVENKLDLTVSLRSHTAGQVSEFVNCIISGNVEKAKRLRREIDENYPIYITTNLTMAKQYCIDRYKGEDHKHYGMLSSSKGGYPHYSEISKFECGAWYVLPRGQVGSGENFDKVATEFACQGLELDMPIVCWKSDVLWSGKEWRTVDDKKLDDRKHRLNSYRVLLTRGRDGMIIYIPNERCFQHTYKFFSDDLDIEELK